MFKAVKLNYIMSSGQEFQKDKEKSANMLPVVSQICRFASQLHESAGGLPKTKLVSHSCSLAGSTSAMKVSNWGGHLHFREVGEDLSKKKE
ncbi:hypothetical protein Tco_0229814 [Tanacetum coccineum]